MTAERVWTPEDTARMLRAPVPGDDKYTRGVLGIATGSEAYPGAAVLGVEAAVRTGVGMVRYAGPPTPTGLVLARRPEVVIGTGRVQAWLVGSGMAGGDERDDEAEQRLRAALGSGVPLVIDAGALDRLDAASGPAVITPHYRELARVLAGSAAPLELSEIAGDAAAAASRAADALGVTVLLKGSVTHVAGPGVAPISVSLGTPWLATAGTGDVLGGVLGALVACHADDVAERGHEALVELSATAAALHGLAGVMASGGAPVAALDVARTVPRIVGALLQANRGVTEAAPR